MPGHTRGQSKAMCGEKGLRPGEEKQALSLHLGSLSMIGRTAFVSMMAEQEDIEVALRNDRPPRDPLT